MSEIPLRLVRPDDAPWIVAQHQALYAANDGFDDSFGPLVARIVEDFFASHNPDCEHGWIAEHRGRPVGCIFCVRLDRDTAKLRLFLVLPDCRGQGLGRRLLDTCLDFARSAGYRRLQLWTHESHRAACALYRAAGFTLISSRPVHSFGCDLVEQSWEIAL